MKQSKATTAQSKRFMANFKINYQDAQEMSKGRTVKLLKIQLAK
jgi:hypothetical protein